MIIKVQVELLMTLGSKTEWIRRCPKYLPKKLRKWETWIWIDKNGNSAAMGEDFETAEKIKSYPVKIYRLIRTTEALNQ